MTTEAGVKEWDKLVTVGSSPGYRDASVTVRLHHGSEMEINLDRHDVLALWRDLGQVLRLAWKHAPPLDAEPGEVAPLDVRQLLEGGAR